VTPTHTILVRLLNENVDVWRPVQAVSLGNNIFHIIEQLYERSHEHWQFEPMTTVECKETRYDNGMQLVAFRRVNAG
jgi:hypothetical protein